MIHGQEDPTVPPSSFNSKLSPTVPAFVPGVIYNPSCRLTVSSSTLSPDVPEFYPSVSHRYHGPQRTVYRDGTAFHDTDNSARHEVCEQLEYNLTAPPQKTKTKTEKSERFKRGNKWKVSDSEANESLHTNVFGNSRKLNKVRSKSTNNESFGVADPSRNTKDFLGVNSTKHQQGKADSTIKIFENGNSGENNTGNQDYPSLQQSHPAHRGKLDPCAKKTVNTPVKDSLAEQNSAKHKSFVRKEDAMPCCTTTQSDTTSHIKSTFVVSYSDKVKSASSDNTQRNENILTHSVRSWTKNFRPDSSFDTKSKIIEENFSRKSSSPFTRHSNKRFAGNLKAEKVNSRTGHTPEKVEKTMDTSKCSQLIDGHLRGKRYSEVSANTKLQRTQQTSRLNATSVSVKTLSCNSDLNWRHNDNDLEISKFGEFKRTESSRKHGCREIDAHSVAKLSDDFECWDSKKQETQGDHKKNEQFNQSDVVRGKPAVYTHEQQHTVKGVSQSLACSSTVVDSDTRLAHKMFSSVEQSVTLNESKPATSSASERTCKELTWDFPDLKDSVKIKKPSIISSEEKARNEKDLNTDISVRHQQKSPVLSYSAALKSAPQPKPVSVNSAKDRHSVAERRVLNLPPHSKGELEDDQNETTEKKKKKKKKKKKDGSKKSQGGSSPKLTDRGIALDLGEMLQTLTESPSQKKQRGKKVLLVATGVLPSQLTVSSPPEAKLTAKAPLRNQGEKQKPHNKLDSTAPVIKRGKERETPARKKPSPLKKIILKEREEKKKAREPRDESCEVVENETCVLETDTVIQPEEHDDTDITGGDVEPVPIDKKVAAEIHSRRFREYCFQVPNKEVDAVATELLKELVRFQDRQFHKDPVKAKAKRRFVLGLREVNKHLKLRKLKCVVISSNVERIKSAGGLDDTLNSIISLCQEYKVPLVFALKRQALGKVLWKRVPVSIVGIINYDGAQEHFKNLIELTEKTSQAYIEKWKEIQEKLESEEQEAEHTEANEEPGEENKTRPSVQSRIPDGQYEMLKGSFPVGETVDRTNLPEDNDSDNDDEDSDNDDEDSDNDDIGTPNKSDDNKDDNDEENDFVREGDLEIENID